VREAAADLDFEEAARLRDGFRAVASLGEQASLVVGAVGIRTYDLSRVRRTLSRPPDVEQVSWKGRPVAFEAAVSVGKIFATY